jgi:hypothetical protein
VNRIFQLGGKNGWYGQELWKIRGFMDKLFGGPGLRRGEGILRILKKEMLWISGGCYTLTGKKADLFCWLK